MDKKRPVLVTSENTKRIPILIVDKKGTMGRHLATKLQKEFLVVLVSGEKTASHEVIHIPFKRKIPVIPDNYYSHLFVFYNGEQEILDLLPSFQRKAHQTNAKLLFITSIHYTSAELFRQLANHVYHAIKIIVYGEVFDEQTTERGILKLFFHQARTNNRIIIPNDGLGKLYPIALDDVFSAIIQTAFTSDQHQRILLALPQHAITELSVARILKKFHPTLKLDFGRYKGEQPHYYLPDEGVCLFPNYPLENRLRKVVDTFEEHEPSFQVRKHMQRFPTKRTFRFWQTVWLFIFALVILPVCLVLGSALSGAGALRLAFHELAKGEIKAAARYVNFAKDAFFFSEQTSSMLFYLDPLISDKKTLAVAQIHQGRIMAETTSEALKGVLLLSNVFEKKSVSPKEDFLEGTALIKKSLVALQKMQAEENLPTAIKSKLVTLEPILLPLQNTIDSFPNLLGFQGKKTYLVLFQNNMELRPGGGFIGSYGLLTIEKGVVVSFTISDVYEADGKLTFHIEPPYGLRRYLGASHWFLRDSNFAVDFPQNASQAMTFLEHETGDKVDGVIALDTTFFTDILEVLGPVTVPEYKETITANNFYLRTQTHVEKNFFPGSTQKKDFLQSLFSAMQQKIVHEKDSPTVAVVGKIGESIQNKHLMFAFRDDATQKLFTVNGLSSALWDGREIKKHAFLDTFGVIDANVGINKVNYYLTRTIEQKAKLDVTGTLSATASVTFVNTSKKDSQFGGDYKNYIRFVLPLQSVVREIAIDGVVQKTTEAVTNPEQFTAKNFIPPKELEIETSSEQGKKLVGFLLFVPNSQSKKVSISYDTAAFAPEMATLTYDLWVFKQPGTQKDSYTYSISYPSEYQILRKTSSLTDVGNKLFFSGVLDEDKNLQAEFSKK